MVLHFAHKIHQQSLLQLCFAILFSIVHYIIGMLIGKSAMANTSNKRCSFVEIQRNPEGMVLFTRTELRMENRSNGFPDQIELFYWTGSPYSFLPLIPVTCYARKELIQIGQSIGASI